MQSKGSKDQRNNRRRRRRQRINRRRRRPQRINRRRRRPQRINHRRRRPKWPPEAASKEQSPRTPPEAVPNGQLGRQLQRIDRRPSSKGSTAAEGKLSLVSKVKDQRNNRRRRPQRINCYRRVSKDKQNSCPNDQLELEFKNLIRVSGSNLPQRNTVKKNLPSSRCSKHTRPR